MNERLKLLLEKHIGGPALPEDLSGLFADLSSEFDLKETSQAQLEDIREHVETCDEIAGIGRWEFDLSNGSCNLVYPWYASEQVIRILGLGNAVETLTTDLFFSTVHRDEINTVRTAFTAAIASLSDFDVEFRTVHLGNEERIIRAKGRIVKDKKTGKALKFAGIVEDVTVMRAAESKLTHANSEIRQIFDSIDEAFWSIDMENYRCLEMSAAAEKIYGYPAASFLTNPNLWFEIIVPEDRSIVYGNHPQLLQGESVVQEYRIRHKDGSTRWIGNRLEPVLDNYGKLIKLYGITTDITRRKEAELARAQNEIKFRSLIEYSADLVVIVSAEGIVQYASGSLHKMTGHELEEFVGTSSFPYMHPDDQDRIREFSKVIVASPGVPMSNTYRRITKDGNYIWCEGTATNLLHVPEVNGIVINIKDITGRIEAEMALKANEYRLSTLLRNSTDAITVVDENFHVVFASESLAGITGFSPEDVYGKTYADFVHPDDREEVEAYFSRVKESHGDPMKIVYRSRKKDNTYFWAERITVNLLHDPVVRGIVSNYRDITDRRNYIEALEVTNDHLQKTNMELDKFVYSVSHDLRAPLSSMLGVIGLMEAEPVSKSTAADLKFLKSSVKKQHGFILDILNHSKNARTGIAIEPVDFAVSVEGVLQNLKFMEGRERINIAAKIEDAGNFISDGSRINVILGNLVSNAIRYSDVRRSDPFVNITISATPAKAVIKVADNGMGIPSDKQQKVYEMFYRLSAKSTGSGLGLYIVKETVEKLKGEILLESEEGKGTVFTVVLPNLENN